MLTNLRAREHVTLSADAPAFDFGDFRVGGPDAGPGKWRRIDGQIEGEWAVGGAHPATIRTALRVDAGTGMVRRQAQVRLACGSDALLRAVTLDTVVARGQRPILRGALQSYPVLCRSFYFGIEFPIATTRVDGDHVVLSHAPGRRLEPGVWYTARTAVYGVAESGRAREAFERYIGALRPRPRGVHFNYNSWWTSPVPYTERDILALVDQFRRNLYVPYHVSPDSFCIDMGWSKATTLWGIDPALFPRGFAPLDRACSAMRSRLGLWISPSGVYGPALDLKWAQSAGFEADTKACLGGARYREALAKSLVDIATRYHLGHVKFDGYVPVCPATDHSHPPGRASAEQIAEGILAVFARLRRAAPDVWMEPTCFGFDPSPWWLASCNSVIGTFGDDAPYGRVPCPVYRESYTTARDFYNLQGVRDIRAPVAAQEVLGIVHQTVEPLQNDAVTTVLRGHQFISLYLNPRYMSARRWEFLAALVQWARRNHATLAETRAILPATWRREPEDMALGAPMPREPYGYAHWHSGRGLVLLRNPWIEPATVSLSLSRDVGVPRTATRLAAVSIYPEERTVASGVPGTGTVRVTLRPYETLLLSIGPARGALPPARRLDAPPGARVRATVTRYEAAKDGPAIGPSHTRLIDPAGPHLRVRLTGHAAPQTVGRSELLVLLEGRGAVRAPVCSVTLGGRSAAARIVSSESGWRATGAEAPEHWAWVRVPLPRRGGRIDAEIITDGPVSRASAWLLTTRDVPWQRRKRVDGTALPPPEAIPVSATCLLPPTAPAPSAPIERGDAGGVQIDGVYLDALEPLFVAQGYGTLQRNRSVWEKPLSIAGRGFQRGIGTHAPARIVYNLGGAYRRFQSWVGADEATGPTVTFEVRVDGRSVWRSGLMERSTPAKRVDVDVTGAKRLVLIVGDGGNGLVSDHADWADAMLLR